MITFQKLKWGYAFSYGDNNEVDFTANTVTQIIGVNGNGKSSIPLILEEAAFNKNSKGLKKGDIPNRYADKGYWINLTFLKEEDQYEIDIQRKSTIKAKLKRNGDDISSHTASNTIKQLEDIIGMDFKMFSQLVYQNTSASLQFLSATDTNRKKFLIDLLNLEEYVRMFDVFKDAVKQHATTVTKIQGQIETVEKWLKQNTLDSEEEIPLLDPLALDTSDEERKIAEVSVSISNIDKTNRQIANNNSYRTLLGKIDIDAIHAIDAEPTKSYDTEQSRLGGLNSDRTRALSAIKRLESLGSACPTCEQPIEDSFKTRLIEEEKSTIADLDSQIAEITSLIASIKENNTRYKHKQEKIKEWEELFASINKTLPEEPLTKFELEDELANLSIRVSNAKQKIKEINLHNQNASKTNSRIAVFKEQSEKFLSDLETAKQQLADEEKNLTTLELLKKAFSTNGLVAYKIENLVKDLEELTNEYLAELSDGRFTIEFAVSSDKLNVLITDNGNTIDIVALSSGELARVNTSTLLALRKLMNSISKSKINVLFLDEVVSVLDDAGKEKLVEVLLKEDLNTFIVSHGWEHPLLAKLEIVKTDDMSRIEHYD